MPNEQDSKSTEQGNQNLPQFEASCVGSYDDGPDAFALIDSRGTERTFGTKAEICLLAAAPDMLAACERAYRVMVSTRDPICDGAIAECSLAMLKARGGA